MAHYVFIDTNMFLSLYDYTDDDLKKLKAFSDLVEGGKVVVYLPEQVRTEFEGNREGKIAHILQQFESKIKSDFSMPRICEGFPEYELVTKGLADLSAARTALLAGVRGKAGVRDLEADHLIQRIMKGAKELSCGDVIIERARLRRDLGKAPGKRDSLGDQINWEALLAGVPEHIKLYVLSRDGDWQSKLTGELVASLADEWKAEKESDCILLDRINKLLKILDLQIEVEHDPQKEVAVQELCGSKSFSRTHSAIILLEPYDSFNAGQVQALVQAFKSNDQISLISRDEDVRAFFGKLVSNHSAVIDAQDVEYILEKIKPFPFLIIST